MYIYWKQGSKECKRVRKGRPKQNQGREIKQKVKKKLKARERKSSERTLTSSYCAYTLFKG